MSQKRLPSHSSSRERKIEVFVSGCSLIAHDLARRMQIRSSAVAISGWLSGFMKQPDIGAPAKKYFSNSFVWENQQ